MAPVSRLGNPSAAVPPCEEEFASQGQRDWEDERWTEEKNQRRCDLINRKYAAGLTSNEARELARLQAQMLRHRDQVAPLPLEQAERWYSELLAAICSPSSPAEP
jgi:hypothetical protein